MEEKQGGELEWSCFHTSLMIDFKKLQKSHFTKQKKKKKTWEKIVNCETVKYHE